MPHQTQQASVTGAQIKDSARRRRNEFEQRRLAFLTVGNRIGTLEIVAGVVVRSPEIDGSGGHKGKVYGNV
jgi:hypothetical protein